jgi:hypothetical protein
MDTFFALRIRNALIALAPDLADLLFSLRFGFRSFSFRTTGWAVPPLYFVKRAMLKTEALRLNARGFVETGTYQGDTTWFLRNSFARIVSIEVEPRFAAVARVRFRRWKNISIVEGDSSKCLGPLAAGIPSPALFWLDGHYSAGNTGQGERKCPIWEELDAIAGTKDLACSIFIDDARLFGTDPFYPSLAQIRDYFSKAYPRHSFSVENDVIKISL